MENRFYRELSRRLAEEGIPTGQPGERGLPVLLHSRPAVFISASGLAYMPGEGGEEERELYHKAAQMSEEVLEYTQAVEQASVLEADTLDTEYRLLAEYGGVVLAGKEMERGYGYQFVTWSRDQDGRGLSHGHYYLNGYKQAKEDFAVRAGLVPKELLVSRRPPETPDPVRSRDPEEYGKEALRELGADQELLDTLEGFTDFASLGRLCMEQDGIHSEAPEMEML